MAEERLKLWQIVVASRAKKGRANEALEALGTMLTRGIISQKGYYESAILMCRDGGWHELAVQLLHEGLNRRIPLDLRCHAAALEACGQGMAWKSALSIISNMQARTKAGVSGSSKVVPDRKCFTAAMVACGRAGRWQEAEKLVSQMTSAGLSQDVVSYNALMNAYAKAGQWEKALDTLNSMEKYDGVKPDLISFNTALDGCANAGQGGACLDLMKEMKGRGIPPDDVSYTNAIAGCWLGNKREAANALITDMERSLGPSKEVVGLIICLALRKAFGSGLLISILEEMVGRDLKPTSKVYGAVLRELGQMEKWQECLKVSVWHRITTTILSFSSGFDELSGSNVDDGGLQVLDLMSAHGSSPEGWHYKGMVASRSSNRYRLRDWNYYYQALHTFVVEEKHRADARRLVWAIVQMINGRVEEEATFRGALEVAKETGQWEMLLNPLLHVKVCPAVPLLEEALSSCRSYRLKIKLGHVLQQARASVQSSCNGSNSCRSSSIGSRSRSGTAVSDEVDGEEEVEGVSRDHHHHHMDIAVTASGGKY